MEVEHLAHEVEEEAPHVDVRNCLFKLLKYIF
jgi:hypothetical protein